MVAKAAEEAVAKTTGFAKRAFSFATGLIKPGLIFGGVMIGVAVATGGSSVLAAAATEAAVGGKLAASTFGLPELGGMVIEGIGESATHLTNAVGYIGGLIKAAPATKVAMAPALPGMTIA